jgi:predicted  nucleic acid-binding Zn-ribbon protein
MSDRYNELTARLDGINDLINDLNNQIDALEFERTNIEDEIEDLDNAYEDTTFEDDCASRNDDLRDTLRDIGGGL